MYINTELQGCFSPVIPGFKRLVDDLLYECDSSPNALTGPPKVLSQLPFDPSLVIQGKAALIRRPVIAVPGHRTYYLWGCFGIPALGPINSVFNFLLGILLPNISPATLDSCAALCDTRGYDAFGMVNGR